MESGHNNKEGYNQKQTRGGRGQKRYRRGGYRGNRGNYNKNYYNQNMNYNNRYPSQIQFQHIIVLICINKCYIVPKCISVPDTEI